LFLLTSVMLLEFVSLVSHVSFTQFHHLPSKAVQQLEKVSHNDLIVRNGLSGYVGIKTSFLLIKLYDRK